MEKTSKQQINKLVASFVEFQDSFSELSSSDAQWAIQNTKETIRLCVKAITKRERPVVRIASATLSEIIATAEIPSSNKSFVVMDKFLVDCSPKAKVKISHLDRNFRAWFLNKTEESFAGSMLDGRQLNKNSIDDAILLAMGGTSKAETTLTEIYALMALQPNGEEGALFSNSRTNIFYVRDVTDTLRAVLVHYCGLGWYVKADSLGFPHVWYADHRVFSRNCLDAKIA